MVYNGTATWDLLLTESFINNGRKAKQGDFILCWEMAPIRSQKFIIVIIGLRLQLLQAQPYNLSPSLFPFSLASSQTGLRVGNKEGEAVFDLPSLLIIAHWTII